MSETDVVPRIDPELLAELRRVAGMEGLMVNELINEAVAEKLAAIQTRAFFAERAARADIGRALEILRRAGRGNPPVAGDELPPGFEPYE